MLKGIEQEAAKTGPCHVGADTGQLICTWASPLPRMFGLVFAIIRRYSTNKSSAVLNSQVAKLHKLGHKKDARQLENRHSKTIRQAVDKQLRMEDRLKGVRAPMCR